LINRNLNQHNRRSIRLKDYDYTTPWWYYITICTYNRKNPFGQIINGKMILSELGIIVEEEWLNTAKLRKDVELDYYVIMPNHFHGIIINNSRGTMHRAPTNPKFGNPISGSLSTIIGAFKAAVTRKINRLIKQPVLKIWQRNFYEHIIRNENDLNNIRSYIELNPLKWEIDEYYNN